ncbi:MAG: hypothetical protein ACP5PT_02535 [Brevinematia bacterium]
MLIRFLVFGFLICFANVVFAEENKTNEVVLPQTQFFVEGAASPVLEERDFSLPPKEEKKDTYESPSVKGIGNLEKEARKEISKENRSKIISLFSYGMNDILNFSMIGLSEINLDSSSLNTVIGFVRFKRPDLVFYYDVPSVFKNTFKDNDFANVSLGFSSSNLFWNTVISFSEDFKGLWKNTLYLDEKDRNVKLESTFKYTVDKDSTLKSSLHIDHFYTTIRDFSFNSIESVFSEFFLSLGYIYGIEDYNSFGFDLGLGGDLSKFIKTNDYSGLVFGDISFFTYFPLFKGEWFFRGKLGFLPDTSRPMEFLLNFDVEYKPNDNIILKWSLFKDYSRFGSDYLTRGLNVLEFLPYGDSSLGFQFSSKLFFLGSSSLNILGGYSYYFSKVYDRYASSLYVLDTTNSHSIYSKLVIDVISIDWLDFSSTYKFSFFYPSLPYIPLHYIDFSLKLVLGGFNVTLSSFGEYLRGSIVGVEDLYPYLGLSIELEWEIVRNLLLILKGENLLNNIIEVRKDSIISEPFYVLGGLKVKL